MLMPEMPKAEVCAIIFTNHNSHLAVRQPSKLGYATAAGYNAELSSKLIGISRTG